MCIGTFEHCKLGGKPDGSDNRFKVNTHDGPDGQAVPITGHHHGHNAPLVNGHCDGNIISFTVKHSTGDVDYKNGKLTTNGAMDFIKGKFSKSAHAPKSKSSRDSKKLADAPDDWDADKTT
jgi:hypothetical protein